MMKREDRAKQFAPFDTLSGLHKALREVELQHERVEKTELSEERAEKLGKAIAKLDRGSEVAITYYDRGFYVKVEGKVAAVDTVYKYIKIGDGKIFFDDLYDIKFI